MDNESNEQVEPCWPFWGQLEAQRIDVHKQIFFQRPENDHFNRFNALAVHALRMLERRDLTEIRFAAEEIGKQIDEEIDAYIEVETDSLVRSLSEGVGYQCQYLPDGSHGTESEIRDLLENWSGEFDDPSGLPERDDLSDLDALSNFLDNDSDPHKEFIQLGLCEAEPHEFYSVLALMTICQTIHSNLRPICVVTYPAREYRYPGELSKSQITAIGNGTIQAVEIMACADKVRFEAQIRKSMAAQWPGLLAAAVNERATERASKAANKRHAKDPKQANKTLTRECWDDWQKQPDRYNGKADFARDMLDKFPNLKSQPVIEGWCRTWARES
jgi:hypothetical protein